jgi:hypothetical protein
VCVHAYLLVPQSLLNIYYVFFVVGRLRVKTWKKKKKKKKMMLIIIITIIN